MKGDLTCISPWNGRNYVYHGVYVKDIAQAAEIYQHACLHDVLGS